MPSNGVNCAYSVLIDSLKLPLLNACHQKRTRVTPIRGARWISLVAGVLEAEEGLRHVWFSPVSHQRRTYWRGRSSHSHQANYKKSITLTCSTTFLVCPRGRFQNSKLLAPRAPRKPRKVRRCSQIILPRHRGRSIFGISMKPSSSEWSCQGDAFPAQEWL